MFDLINHENFTKLDLERITLLHGYKEKCLLLLSYIVYINLNYGLWSVRIILR